MDWQPTAADWDALFTALTEEGVFLDGDLIEAKKGGGSVAPIIAKFGSWAGNSHKKCVAELRGKKGIKDPARL